MFPKLTQNLVDAGWYITEQRPPKCVGERFVYISPCSRQHKPYDVIARWTTDYPCKMRLKYIFIVQNAYDISKKVANELTGEGGLTDGVN